MNRQLHALRASGTCACIVPHQANRGTYLADNALGVDDEEATEGNASVLDQDTVVLAELVVLVADQRDVDAAETAVLAGNGAPGEQAVLGVGRGESDGDATLVELLDGIAEGDDLSGADEGPRHGNEGKDEPLALGGVVGEADLCAVQARQTIGSRLAGGLDADLPSKVPSTTAVTLKSGAGC